jgi:hypothetical protein
MAPLAPGRGEGPGVRGEVPLEAGFAEPRMSTDEGCFWATDEHGFSRMNRRGSWAFSPFNFLVSPHYGRDAMSPSPPTPLPLRGRGEEFVFLGCSRERMAPLAPGRGEGPGVRGEGPLGLTRATRQCRTTHHAPRPTHAPRGQPRAATVRERVCLAQLARCCCVTLVAGAVMPALRQVSGGRSSC